MNCKIVGYDLKSLMVELEPGEHFYCEKGAIIYYEGGIEKDIKVLDKGITSMLKRKLSGESIFLVELVNRAHKVQKLMLAGRSGLLPINLSEFRGEILCRGGYYVASSKNLDIDFAINLSSWISGTGLIMQKIRGEGTLFLDSIGTACRIDVPANESVFIDEKSFICIDAQAENRIQSSFSGRGFLGGEGLTMFQVMGPATVYVNSVNVR